MAKEQKQAKKSILQIILERLKEKPATEQEIMQLRLEAEKYRLKAEIAKSKAIIRDSKTEKFSQGGSSSKSSGFAESYSDTEDRISKLLRGAVGASDVEFENDDGKSEKEAYRKRVLGL